MLRLKLLLLQLLLPDASGLLPEAFFFRVFHSISLK